MKLTNDDTARVFAMYWGCEFLIEDLQERHTVDAYYLSSYNATSYKDKYKLLLTPLAAITDEDKLIIGEIIDPTKEHEDEYNGYTYTHLDVGKSFIEYYLTSN